MSEQNILNPTATSTLNPDFTTPIKISDPQIIARWQARSGKPFFRTLMARGQAFDMVWDKRLFADYLALEQWFHQYEADFFTYFDIDRNRYYSGMFADQPQYERIGNNQVTISAQFIVVPTLPLFQYPGNWGVESIFRDERDGFGNDLVKLGPLVFTNLLLWSEQFDNAAWVKDGGSTVTANNVTDPFGGATGDTFTKGSGSFVQWAHLFQLLTGDMSGKSWTFSIWLKVASGTQNVFVALADNTLHSDPAQVTVTTSWQRFSHSASGFNNTGFISGGIVVLAGAGTQIQVWGAQLEPTTDIGLYVQTTAASASLVTPLGRWDHADKNFFLRSEQFDNGSWLKSNAAVTADAVIDPNGNLTAESVTFSGGVPNTAYVGQTVAPIPLVSKTFTFSCWIKAASSAPTIDLIMEDVFAGHIFATQTMNLTTIWQRFSVTGTTSAAATAVTAFMFNASNQAIAYHIWGAQLEFGAAPTAYTQTVGAAVALLAPAADAKYHRGFAYFNAGTAVNDAAEWKYIGYGFRVWAYKGPDMGIMQVFLDGVSQGTVDLYAAAPTASAAVFTVQNVTLGEHRVKLMPTNTKNGASAGFIVTADAIEVMR